MEEEPQEKYLIKEEQKDEQLPYLRVAESKDMKQQVEEVEVETALKQKVLLGVGGVISAYLMLSILADCLAYPIVIVWLMKLFALAEASIPLALSFILKNEYYAKVLRLIGIVVFSVYLFQFLWSGFWGGL